MGDGNTAAGLVRRREVPAAAAVWALSNGALARRLGWAGLALLPVTYPVHLMMVCFARPRLRRRGRGVCMVTSGPAALDLGLGIGSYVLLLVWVAAVMIALDLMLPPLVALLTVLFVVLIDVGGAVMWAALKRTRRRGIPSLAAAHRSHAWAAPCWVVAGFCCFPRGHKQGTKFMEWLRDELDAAAVIAVLDARTDRLASFYGRFGFEQWTDAPRRMVRFPGPAHSSEE